MLIDILIPMIDNIHIQPNLQSGAPMCARKNCFPPTTTTLAAKSLTFFILFLLVNPRKKKGKLSCPPVPKVFGPGAGTFRSPKGPESFADLGGAKQFAPGVTCNNSTTK